MSTKQNHRCKNRAQPADRVVDIELHNGYGGTKHGYLDKSMHGWGDKGELSGKLFGASIGNDFSNGHRGMAKAVRGAKKFVRTRVRFHENAATRKLAADVSDD